MAWRRAIGSDIRSSRDFSFAGAVGGYLFLKDCATFQEYALRTIVQETNDATGGRSRDSHPRFSNCRRSLPHLQHHPSWQRALTKHHSCRSTNSQWVSFFNPWYVARLR